MKVNHEKQIIDDHEAILNDMANKDNPMWSEYKAMAIAARIAIEILKEEGFSRQEAIQIFVSPYFAHLD